MAVFLNRKESFEREVWAVKTPTNHAEVSKALSAATAAACVDNGGRRATDDYVTVESDETEIRFVITRRVHPKDSDASGRAGRTV